MRFILVLVSLIFLGIGSAYAAEHTVNIQSFKFNADELTIAVGDSVRFINLDGAPHTATADDGSFDTGRLSKTDEFVVTFDSAGAFSYFCSIHRNMKALITVQ